MNILGIDIGGTKTSVSIGSDDGQILATERMPSATSNTIEHYERDLANLCASVLNQVGLPKLSFAAAGISAPGPLDVKRGVLIAPPNLPAWHDVPIVKMVHRITGLPTYLNNDANAAALAEFEFGQYRHTPNLVYLTFSTGIGGGIISGGRLVQGITDAGGEVGHQVLEVNGPLCRCGQRGCWETFVGGWQVAAHVREKISQYNLKTSLVAKAGGIEKITLEHIRAAAVEGDLFAVAEWDNLVERLAQGIGSLIMILNPKVVLLGTTAIHAGDFVMKPIREKLSKYCWPRSLEECVIATSTLGEKIGDYAAQAVAILSLKTQHINGEFNYEQSNYRFSRDFVY